MAEGNSLHPLHGQAQTISPITRLQIAIFLQEPHEYCNVVRCPKEEIHSHHGQNESNYLQSVDDLCVTIGHNDQRKKHAQHGQSEGSK